MIKDRITSWFIKNVMKPRMENIDNPGFVIANVGEGKPNLREVFLPEMLIADIEDRVGEKYDDADEILYGIGKRFGWRYANASRFPKSKNTSEKKFKRFFDFFIKYIETIYASRISYDLNLDDNEFWMETEEYAVCRNNGKGYLLTEGAVTGVMAYLFDNTAIDSEKIKCQGRGDPMCEIECSPNVEGYNIDREHLTEELRLGNDYKRINKVRSTKSASHSAKDLLDTGFFEYQGGILTYKDNRLLIVESSLVYMLECESRLDDKLLYKSAYKYGKKLGDDRELSFLTDYLSALGWGDVKPLNKGKKVHVRHYPWTRFAEDSDFPIFRGLVSGIISGMRDEEIHFNDWKTNISGNGFELTLSSN